MMYLSRCHLRNCNAFVAISLPLANLVNFPIETFFLPPSYLVVTIDATKESVRFAVKGDLGNGSIAIRSGGMAIDKKDMQGTSISMRQPACISVSLKFLTQFTKATPLSETVRLEFTNDCPMLIEYPVGDMGYIRFYLAPKVDDEDEDK